MEFLIGLLSGVVLFILLLTAVYIGYRLGRKNGSVVSEPDEEQARKAKKLHEDFVKLMNYDVSTALQRKKVK